MTVHHNNDHDAVTRKINAAITLAIIAQFIVVCVGLSVVVGVF